MVQNGQKIQITSISPVPIQRKKPPSSSSCIDLARCDSVTGARKLITCLRRDGAAHSSYPPFSSLLLFFFFSTCFRFAKQSFSSKCCVMSCLLFVPLSSSRSPLWFVRCRCSSFDNDRYCHIFIGCSLSS